MTNTQIGTMVNVGVTSDITPQYNIALDLARDFLKGETSDYLFFYYGDTVENGVPYSQFVLITGDLIRTPSDYPPVYQFDSCTVRQFYVRDTLHLSTITSQFHGNTFEVDPSPVGSFSGSAATPEVTHTYTTFSFAYTLTSCQVSNSADQCFYSSFELDPHLVEGVENYAFTACVIAFCVIAFNLADRLFRRVY